MTSTGECCLVLLVVKILGKKISLLIARLERGGRAARKCSGSTGESRYTPKCEGA